MSNELRGVINGIQIAKFFGLANKVDWGSINIHVLIFYTYHKNYQYIFQVFNFFLIITCSNIYLYMHVF